MRAVVFRTPGKLDLRALTIFGLNAKPNSDNPIGFFGTGLKYAIAVLARNKLPVTIWIGHQRWTIEYSETNFRGKEFSEIILRRHGTIRLKPTRTLPFTTELGKTWELWQAFRELYANTIDEQGEAFIWDDPLNQPHGDWDRDTIIVVEGEVFIQEFLDREKTFLPVALRRQTSKEPVQKFDRPAKHIYWRGMRIYDLKKPSMVTWNILKPIDVTEDRTAKYPYQIDLAIEEYIREHAPKPEIKRFISANVGNYESSLTYQHHYKAPSQHYIEAVKEVPRDTVNPKAREDAVSYDDSIETKVPIPQEDLINEAIKAIQNDDWSRLEEVISQDKEHFITALERYQKSNMKDLKHLDVGLTSDHEEIPF